MHNNLNTYLKSKGIEYKNELSEAGWIFKPRLSNFNNLL